MHIGFMGLGIMGIPMCDNILKAGHELTVYNRTKPKADALVQKGAKLADTPLALAQTADAVVCMVTGPEATDALLFGVGGAAPALSGKVFVSMSSVAPEYSRSLAEKLALHGADFVDAPVSGSKKPAEDGQLVILAGGKEATVQGLAPLFDALGKHTVHCGPAGTGSMMKMAVNLLLAVMTEGLAEMIDFGRKGGLQNEDMLDVVLSGPMANALFGMKKDMFLTNDFPVQFPLKHMAKDLRFMVETADETGAQVPAGRAVRDRFRMAMEQGLADEDFAAVFQTMR